MQHTHMAIFAKHDDCPKEYIFAVPYELHNIKKGDLLIVDTIKGQQIVTATSEIIEGENLDEIAIKYGAYMPLKKVIAVQHPLLKNYIETKERRRLASEIESIIDPCKLPF